MRPLTDDESQLVGHLVGLANLVVDVAALRAEPMNDGSMGSLRFASTTEGPNFSASAAEVTFEDEDGVPVSAALYVDQSGALFELDVWKMDFSPLLRWPGASDLARSEATQRAVDRAAHSESTHHGQSGRLFGGGSGGPP